MDEQTNPSESTAPHRADRPLPSMVDGLPRRARIDHATFVEEAIRDARAAVEEAGADVRLTNATNHLGRALDAVADYLEDVNPSPPVAPDGIAAQERPVEVGWMIERTDVSRPTWWAGADQWTTDADAAVRFARQADADRVVAAQLVGHHFHVGEHHWG